MPRKDETKDREYYMNECFRLRNRLKNAQQKNRELKKHAKETSIAGVESLKRQNKTLLKDMNKQQETIIHLRNKLQLQTNKQQQHRKHAKIYKAILDTFTLKNKKVFHDYFEKELREDCIRLPISTILQDLNYAFAFVKFFEMHVFDYVVNRQNPDDKTEADTVKLIADCKEFTTHIITDYIFKEELDIKGVKREFQTWVAPYLDPSEMGS